MLDLKGRKVLVLGLGDTGLSMTRWLVAHGALVRVADSREEPPHAATLAREFPQARLETGAFNDDTMKHADVIAISPGIDRREAPIADAIKRGVPVVGDVELFAQALKSAASDGTPQVPNSGASAALRGAEGQIPVAERGPSSAPWRAPFRPKILAVTGSNGKSTVTAMAGEMCRAAERITAVAGNIGLPVLDALSAVEAGAPMPEIFVLELSSFQLESTTSLEADAATMLNLSEDHMDRYDALDDYAAAKERIFAGHGVQVLNRDDPRSMDMARSGRSIVTFGLDAPRTDAEWGVISVSAGRALACGTRALLAVDELPVAGMHNAANALAALALARAIDLPEAALVNALRAYNGLPHRMQKVAEFSGVVFYDDSKGTNVGATVAALAGLMQPVVLIAGGDGKGQDFSPLAAPVSAHAREVVLIGRDAGAIARALEGCNVPLKLTASMEEAVAEAFHASRPGDAVLLSPACASYDMFRNYVHRAEVFVAAVNALAGGRS